MAIKTSIIKFKTTSRTDILDITARVQQVVRDSQVTAGLVTLFIAGSTAALTTIEYEDGVVNDLQKAVERLAPMNMAYEHDRRWGDGNGYSHVRAALLGPSLTIPLVSASMVLGTWQQIVLCDFDNRPRTREVVVQILASE